MRIVFMGTPSFAVPSLRALTRRHDVVAAYVRPDKPSGRGRTPVAPAVKQEALGMGIPVFQPLSLRDPGEAEILGELRPDVVCVAAYGMILPDDVLALPPLGCVNVHASLLPEYRGAAPIQRAILDGAEATGISIMRIVRELDAGPYAAQARVEIGDLDAGELGETLARLGGEALLAVLDEIAAGTVVWVAQDDAQATFAPKISAADVALLPEITAEDAWRRVRASSASAPARLLLAGKRVTVLHAEVGDERLEPGALAVGKSALAIGFTEGSLRLTTIKPEGRSEMEGAAYARGARLGADARWGAWE